MHAIATTAILKISHDGRSWEVQLTGSPATIGRYADGSTNTIDLSPNDTMVSRRHAEIVPVASGYELRNLSSNGVTVNGVATERALLRSGDVIRIGTASMSFQDSGDAPRRAGIKLGRRVEDDPTPLANPIVRVEQLPPAATAGGPAAPTAVAQEAKPADTSYLRAGYSIEGRKPRVKAGEVHKSAAAQAKSVNPVILVAAAGALLVLLLVIVVGPSKPGTEVAAKEYQQLIVKYRAYVEKAKQPDVERKVAQLQKRLDAIAWAERTGNTDAVKHELNVVLLMDGDRTSPAYEFAVKRLGRMK